MGTRTGIATRATPIHGLGVVDGQVTAVRGSVVAEADEIAVIFGAGRPRPARSRPRRWRVRWAAPAVVTRPRSRFALMLGREGKSAHAVGVGWTSVM